MSAERYRQMNSYYNDDDERIPALAVSGWDVLIYLLTAARNALSGLIFLTKAHANQRVERKAVEMEMRESLEAIIQ